MIVSEDSHIILLSVTLGENKQFKYTTMFQSVDIIIVNKIDITEVVEFN